MKTIGIGIIGSGFMGRTYSETVAKYCKNATLKAVAGGSRAAALAKDYSIDHEDSVEALVARDDIQLVFISTPHHLHYENAMAAARAGKHMLIEKPMATSVEQCDEILDACKKAGVFSSIAFTQRYRDCNIKAKELLSEGSFGRIQQIKELQLLPVGLGGLPKWQSSKENLGTLFGHAVHNIDRVRWLTGQEIKTVYAKCTSFEPGSSVEASSMLVMTLTDGALVNLWSSFQIPKPSFSRSQFATWIVCENGLIDLDAYGELRVTRDTSWEVAATQEPIDWQGKGALDPVRMRSYALQCQDLIDAALEDRSPAVTGWDGRQTVAVALAAYMSSGSGKEIVLS